MAAYSVDDVVARYVSLRAEKAALAARHEEEMKPISDGMVAIETWLMAKANELGVDSFKTSHGTAFKTTQTSVTMADKSAFVAYILDPLVQEVHKLLDKVPGYKAGDIAQTLETVERNIRWNLADLRVGKKGVQEVLELGGTLPPGVNMTQMATISVRKS